jgi:hypothetical protein
VGLSREALRGKEALEVGPLPPERVVRFFTTQVTLDQTLGNWYHFIKPIHRIKNLLAVNQLLNAVSYFIFVFLSGLCKPLLCGMLFIG